jgi:hypothetical protein
MLRSARSAHDGCHEAAEYSEQMRYEKGCSFLLADGV